MRTVTAIIRRRQGHPGAGAPAPWLGAFGLGLSLLLVGSVAAEAQTSDPADSPIVTIRPAPPKTAPVVKKTRKAPARKPTSSVRRPVRKAPQQTAKTTVPTRRRRTAAAPTKRRTSRVAIAPEKKAPAVAAAAGRKSGFSVEGPVSLNGRAYRLQKQGRHAAAELLLRRALELKPDYAYALYNLGWSLVAQGKAREAIEPLTRTAAMQPGRWEPYQRLSDAYAQLGEPEKAAAYALRAQSLRNGPRGASSRAKLGKSG